MGRSRGGPTSKIHAVDTHGLPIRLALTAGEALDNRLAGKLLSRLKSGTMLLADRGYDADWIRALATERGVWANIPPRCNRTTRSASARISTVPAIWSSGFSTRSNSVVASPLATNYLAFIQLASIRLGCAPTRPRPSPAWRPRT